MLAFSTANLSAMDSPVAKVETLSNDAISPVFEATVQATEEAIINSMVAAQTMRGFRGHCVKAIPHDRLRDILQKYNRLAHLRT
jgi:L-aminopeptidase/D-esterase-like protein